MDVSIIIVNYNTLQLTKDCLDSIFKHTKDLAFEVILVDNNSIDGSVDCFSKDKRLIFIEAGKNLGFGRANNLGLKQAKGKYIFFLNSDTLLVNNAVKEFYDFAESTTGKIGAIGCLLRDKAGNVIHSFSKFPSINWVFNSVIVAHIYQILFHKKYQLYDITNADVSQIAFCVDYVTGADLFVNRNVINECGAFDSDFFMYYEETEMQYRWTKRGYLSYIIKSPHIIHLEGGSQDKSNQFKIDKFIRSFKSEKLYFYKIKSNLGYLIYRLSTFFYILVFVKNKISFHNAIKGINVLVSKKD